RHEEGNEDSLAVLHAGREVDQHLVARSHGLLLCVRPQRTGAGLSAGRDCHLVAATTRPLAAVSAATVAIAVFGEVASAANPAIRAPATKPKSRQKRYTPTVRARSRGCVASETAAIRVG